MADGSFKRTQEFHERFDRLEWTFLARNMERRQKNVASLIELERLLSSSDYGADSALVGRLMSRMPDMTVRAAAKEVVADYGELIQNAKSEERFLKKKSIDAFGDASAESLGALLFSARTGRESIGPVTLVRREGYLILSCPSPTDYNIFTDPSLPGRTADEFTRQVESLLQHGGTFHATLALDPKFDSNSIGVAGVLSTPVIVIKSTDGSYGYNQVLTHERQHFIHHKLLHLFQRGERKKKAGAETPAEFAARQIKDEVVAFVRDGASGSQIGQYLGGDVYAHLYDRLPQAEGTAFRSVVASIASRIDAHRIFAERESRPALAMQLLDIPLSMVPDAIPVIAEYYQKRIDSIRSVELPGDMVSDGMTASPGYSTERMRLRASLVAFYRQKNDCAAQAFSSPSPTFEASVQNLRIRSAAVIRDVDALRIFGVMIPSGTFHYVDGQKSKAVSSRKLEVAAKESFQDILSKLTTLPSSVRTDFVRLASEKSAETFSIALTRGIGDAIVRPLMARGADRIEITDLRAAGKHDPNSVYIGVETTFPRLDGIHKVVYNFLIHGKPERTEHVFKS